jgi:hypothetical protein
MVHVVEQVHVEADLAPQPIEERRDEVEIALRAPDALERLPLLRRLVVQLAAADAVGVQDAWNRALRADGAVADLHVVLHRQDRFLLGRSVGVPVDEHRVA